MVVRIRDFALADQTRAAALIQAGMRERWGDDFDPSANPDLDDIWSSYMTDGAVFLVAVTGKTNDEHVVIGTGGLVPGPKGRRIVRMSVDRQHRRRGVARSLVAALLDRADAMGERRVVVSTDSPWTDAVALYIACGFDVTARDGADTHFAITLPA